MLRLFSFISKMPHRHVKNLKNKIFVGGVFRCSCSLVCLIGLESRMIDVISRWFLNLVCGIQKPPDRSQWDSFCCVLTEKDQTPFWHKWKLFRLFTRFFGVTEQTKVIRGRKSCSPSIMTFLNLLWNLHHIKRSTSFPYVLFVSPVQLIQVITELLLSWLISRRRATIGMFREMAIRW